MIMISNLIESPQIPNHKLPHGNRAHGIAWLYTALPYVDIFLAFKKWIARFDLSVAT